MCAYERKVHLPIIKLKLKMYYEILILKYYLKHFPSKLMSSVKLFLTGNNPFALADAIIIE